jgi:multiple sugar transport system substrate-binding protein
MRTVLRKARAIVAALFVTMSVATAAAQTQITFWHIFDAGPSAEWIDEVIQRFNAANPDIRVTHLGTNFWDYWTRLTTATAGGIGPDVALNDMGNVPSRAESGVILPLDDLLGPEGLEPFWPATREAVTWNGHVWAMPIETDVRVLFYNKALFRAAGLDPEDPPETWEELVEYADKLTVVEGGRIVQLGFGPTLGNTYFPLYAMLNGEDFLAEDGTLRFNTPAAVEALQWMVDRQNAYGSRAMTSFAATFGTGASDPFMSGKVAMIIQNNTFPGQIAQYAPDLEYGVALLPHNGTPASWSNGFSLEISASTRAPEAAYRLVEYLMSDEIQAEYARLNFSMVGNMAAAQSEELMADPNWRVFVEQMETSRFRAFSLEVPTWYDLVLQPEVDAALLGMKTPQQALDDAQRNYENEVRRYHETT